MNKALTPAEVSNLAEPWSPPMTRQEKLIHWAKIIRDAPHQMRLYSQLEEYATEAYDEMTHEGTAFALAFNEPAFRANGLQDRSVGGCMRFFELSRDDLHAFSCDCGGLINNERMAQRIESIARPAMGHARRDTTHNVIMQGFQRLVGALNHR